MTVSHPNCCRARGFSVIELLLSTGLLVLLLSFMIPCWIQWQGFARKQLGWSVAEWDKNFLEHRLYQQAMLASAVEADGAELKLTAGDTLLYYGVNEQRMYERGQNRKYLTYAPVEIKDFSLTQQGSLVQVAWDTWLGDHAVSGVAYVP